MGMELSDALTKSNLEFNPGGIKNENSDQGHEKFETREREPKNSYEESCTHYFNKPQFTTTIEF